MLEKKVGATPKKEDGAPDIKCRRGVSRSLSEDAGMVKNIRF